MMLDLKLFTVGDWPPWQKAMGLQMLIIIPYPCLTRDMIWKFPSLPFVQPSDLILPLKRSEKTLKLTNLDLKRACVFLLLFLISVFAIKSVLLVCWGEREREKGEGVGGWGERGEKRIEMGLGRERKREREGGRERERERKEQNQTIPNKPSLISWTQLTTRHVSKTTAYCMLLSFSGCLISNMIRTENQLYLFYSGQISRSNVKILEWGWCSKFRLLWGYAGHVWEVGCCMSLIYTPPLKGIADTQFLPKGRWRKIGMLLFTLFVFLGNREISISEVKKNLKS